jgi:hypothetical protein
VLCDDEGLLTCRHLPTCQQAWERAPTPPHRRRRRGSHAIASVTQAQRLEGDGPYSLSLKRRQNERERGNDQIPPDCVVKSHAIDVAEVILALIRPPNVVSTRWSNRQSRRERLSTSETHGLPLSLSRLNYQWPECEVHPEMIEGVVARPLCLQRGLTGCNEALQRVHRHTEDSQERGRAGL